MVRVPEAMKMDVESVTAVMQRKRCAPPPLVSLVGRVQRLMETVLAGLNPEDGPDFVVVYIDDVLVFSIPLKATFLTFKE